MLEISDEQLVLAVRKNDVSSEEAMSELLKRYRNRVFAMAQSFSEEFADDLASEGMLALVYCTGVYDFDYGVKFVTFANRCILNRMKNALRKISRYSGEVPLDLISEVADSVLPPDLAAVEHETDLEFDNLTQNALTKLERNVLLMYIEGLSYKNIAEMCQVSVKSVDNAMNRVRSKLRIYFNPMKK